MSKRAATSAPAGKTTLSIIVPAYKEAANLDALITRVFVALEEHDLHLCTELLVVDDNSGDGSVEVVAATAKRLQRNARILVRTKERGLSSAVLHGFDQAKGDALLCMDADLQHPPEKVPDLANALLRSGNMHEFVIGTRYTSNSLPAAGKMISPPWPPLQSLRSPLQCAMLMFRLCPRRFRNPVPRLEQWPLWHTCSTVLCAPHPRSAPCKSNRSRHPSSFDCGLRAPDPRKRACLASWGPWTPLQAHAAYPLLHSR